MKSAWLCPQKRNALSGLTFVFFKVMGLAPFAMDNRNNVKDPKDSRREDRRFIPQFVPSRLGGLYNLCLIVCQVYLTFLSWEVSSDQEYEYPYKSYVSDKIESVLTVYGNGVIVLIWLMCCTKQDTLTTLVNRLKDIDVALDGVKGSSAYVHEGQSGTRNVIVIFVTQIVLWIQLLITEELSFHAPMITSFNFIVPCIGISWFTIQLVLAVNLIENRFKMLNDMLLNCSMTDFVFPIRAFLVGLVSIEDFREAKIVRLRKVHTRLYEVSSGVANFYSLPILFIVGFFSICLLYNAYYLIMLFEFGTAQLTKWVVVNTILWLLAILLPMTMLIVGVVGVTEEMKKTADVIPDLLTRSTTSQQDKTELGTFAFELLHKDVEYTGYRLFPLDSTLLPSIVGMITTYLTIIFELQSGNFESADPSSSVPLNSSNPSTEMA